MTVHTTPPSWLGIALFVLGIAVLLASPKIVALYLWLTEKLNDWFLKLVAEVSGIPYSLPGQSILWKAARVSCWLTTLLAGALLIMFGTLLLLKVSCGFWPIPVRKG